MPATLALRARESHPIATGTHIVDLFPGKIVQWQTQPAIDFYHAYDNNHANDRAIRCAYKIATPTPALSESAAVESNMQTIYAGHIHYYATDMRRPRGVWFMASASNG